MTRDQIAGSTETAPPLPPGCHGLSDGRLYQHERELLKMFLMGVLTSGSAISDRMGVLTWANPYDTEGVAEGLCLIYRDFHEGTRRIKVLAPTHVDYETLIMAAVDSVISRNEGCFDDIAVHETVQSDSSGISWKWIRRQTMVPATICLGNPIAAYVQRQERRAAEADPASTRDLRARSTDQKETEHDSQETD